MSKRPKRRSNHKPRGLRLVEYQAGLLVRAAVNAYMSVHLPEWRWDNRIELIWQTAGHDCDICGAELVDVLAPPFRRPVTLCVPCWAAEPFPGSRAVQ